MSARETPTAADFVRQPTRHAHFEKLGQVCRAGLATRGNTHLEVDAIREAVRRGVNYLNWCGYRDGLSAAVRDLGDERPRVHVAVQFNARSAAAAQKELREVLGELGTSYVDVVTYYYVEHESEWQEIVAPGGAAEYLESARADGVVKSIGVTSHQRVLAARMARSGRVDMLMIRYNAAHRGAETEVFPVTQALAMPVVTYTGVRWGALMKQTPDDPTGFAPPGAPSWYRWVLCQPAVTVGIMAPDGEQELEEDLRLLDDWQGMSHEEYESLSAHGDRVRHHAGNFP